MLTASGTRITSITKVWKPRGSPVVLRGGAVKGFVEEEAVDVTDVLGSELEEGMMVLGRMMGIDG